MSDENRIDNYQDKIIIFFKQNGRMPSYSELQNLTHYRSKGGVAKLVEKLEERNFLRRDRGGKLIPGFNFFGIPFPGMVQAGFPSPNDIGFANGERLDLYSFLVRKPRETFIHQVTGDSMIGDGIYPGDMVISERTDSARVGKIVIAEVNGSCTIKRLRYDKERDYQFLEASNPEHAPIYSDEGNEITILAQVMGVVRKFEAVSHV